MANSIPQDPIRTKPPETPNIPTTRPIPRNDDPTAGADSTFTFKVTPPEAEHLMALARAGLLKDAGIISVHIISKSTKQ